MAEEIGFKITVDTNVADLSVGELKQGFKDLTAELGKTKEGTVEFTQTLNKLGEVRSKIKGLKDEINALNPEKRFAAIANVGSTIASGFAAAQGAVALFGGESEDLTKTLVKVQAAMALAQGLQGLSGFTRALKTAGLAMKAFALSNPFSAIAVAVVALTVAIVATVKSMDDSAKAMERLNFETERFKQLTEGSETFWKRRIALMKAQGASIEEVATAQRQAFEEEREFLNEQIIITQKLIDGGDKEAIEKQRVFIERGKDLVNEKRIFELQVIQDIEDRETKASDKKRAAREKELAELKAFRDELWSINQEDHDRRKALDLALFKDQEDFIAKTIALWEKEAADEIRVRDALTRATIELELTKYDGLIAIANIGGQLAGKNKALADTFFAIEKGLAIAKIIVSTQAEIAGYFGTASAQGLIAPPLAPVFTATAIAQATAAKIRAGIGIATIAAASVSRYMNGGGSVGGATGATITTPNIQSPNLLQAGQITETNVNQDNQGNFAGFGAEGGRIKAYVVETEISEKQKGIKSIEERTTF